MKQILIFLTIILISNTTLASNNLLNKDLIEDLSFQAYSAVIDLINQQLKNNEDLNQFKDVLNIVLPINLNVELSQTNKTLQLVVEKGFVLNLTKNLNEPDLIISTTETELFKLFIENEKDFKTYLSNSKDEFVFNPKTLKGRLIVETLQKDLGVELNLVKNNEPNFVEAIILTIYGFIIGFF